MKDTLLPVDANYSVDSLDCGEQDMMLTCLANKENYTIAFEGSTLMHGSDDYQGTGTKLKNSKIALYTFYHRNIAVL